MLKLHVSNAYVVAAVQRALEQDFAAMRCPRIARIGFTGGAKDDDREFIVYFAPGEQTGAVEAEPTTERPMRRHMDISA